MQVYFLILYVIITDEDLRNKLLAEFLDHSIEDETENENPNTGGLVIVTFIWIQGLRENSKLMWVPNEENLYYANVRSREYDAMGYTCYVKKCTARIYLKDDGTAFKTQIREHCNHETMYSVYREMQYINAMKENCQNASASITIREIYNDAVLE